IELTFHYDSKIAKTIERDFNEQYGNLVTTFASNPVAIDAVKYGINKATGLKNLLARFNLTSEDLIAFGDSGNDIAMLDFAKY
ncbi:HAD-IIB family hydrolase, partial [Citrobacter sp. UMB8248A]|nr:HAD-IIB family hydrolase [Citrobacter sp. UMB8248A]